MRTGAWLIIGTMLMGLGVPLVRGQSVLLPYNDVGGRISRPGSGGPSQFLGGRYSRLAPLAATRRDVNLLGQDYFQFGNTNRQYRSSRALSTAQVGMPGYRERVSSGARVGMRYNRDLGMLAGLNAVTDPGIPLPEVRSDFVPSIDAYRYTPRPATDRFQELLGLAPLATATATGEPVGTVAEQLEMATQARVRRAEREGLDLFKHATVETRSLDPVTKVERYQQCADCDEKLREAISNLRLVNNLDTKAYLPSLLIVHAYLEQDRVRQALDALLEAVRRQPDLPAVAAAQAGAFAEYFGDARNGSSLFLEAQMRRYSRLSELNPDNAEALALEIYCTWRLGEWARAREGAQKLEKLAMARPTQNGYLREFALAMRDVRPTPP